MPRKKKQPPVQRILRPREGHRDVGNKTDSVVISNGKLQVIGNKRKPLLEEKG